MILYKIKNFLILLLCFFYFLYHGKANKKIKEVKKVLVVQTAKLGDMVCTTPIFRAIKLKYPNCLVYVLGKETNKELLKNNLDVDNYIIYDNKFFKLLKIIRREKFDFACIITPNFINLVLLYLSSVPLIVAPKVTGGFCPYETKSYKILRNFVVTKPHCFGNYAPKEYLRLLEPLDIITEDTTKYLFYSNEADKKIINYLKENNIDLKNDFLVGIAPSVANKIKLWTAERFAKIADYLFEKYQAKIIIIGGNDDRQEIERMIGFLNKSTPILDISGIFNLDELKALISKLKIFISVDTGPIYIAEAFNIPTVDIVGPMAENEQPPRGRFHKIVKLENRQPQLHIMNARIYDEKEARRQIEEITVEAVIDKINELIKELNV